MQSPRHRSAKSRFSGDMRRALIDAALACVAEVGLEGLTLRAVARRAGVTHQAPYRHFADRGALLAAVAEEGFRQLWAAAMEPVMAAGTDPEARLRALALSYVRFALAHPMSYRVMFCREVADKREYPSLKQASTRSFELVTTILLEAQRAKRFRRGDAQDQAMVLISLVQGFASFLIDGQFKKRGYSKATAEATVARLLEQVYAGLRTR
jgi:AcrR family transcriptional regulator